MSVWSQCWKLRCENTNRCGRIGWRRENQKSSCQRVQLREHWSPRVLSGFQSSSMDRHAAIFDCERDVHVEQEPFSRMAGAVMEVLDATGC